MSCDHCLDLFFKYVIHQPEQLRKAIRIAKHALSEGILTEFKATDDWNQDSFHECAKNTI